MTNGEAKNGEAKKEALRHSRLRTGLAAAVVVAALGAVVLSLLLVLDNYDVEGTTPAAGGVAAEVTASASDTASVSASSVVAVLTPVMAGILGITGLYFGISATGSARGRQAEVDQEAIATVKAIAKEKEA